MSFLGLTSSLPYVGNPEGELGAWHREKAHNCGVNKGPMKENGLGEGVLSERSREQDIGSRLNPSQGPR